MYSVEHFAGSKKPSFTYTYLVASFIFINYFSAPARTSTVSRNRFIFSSGTKLIEKIYWEVYNAANTHPKSSEQMRRLSFIQDPLTQENPYILPSPLKNTEPMRDYDKTILKV